MIIDAHTHIFPEIRGMIARGPTRSAYFGRISVGAEQVPALPPICEETRHTPEMLLAYLDWVGVDRAVLLQGTFYGEWNDYVLDAIQCHPDRFIGAAYIDPWDGHSREIFNKIAASGAFQAVKLECSEATGFCGIHPGARLDNPRISWLWSELENRHLVLVLDLGAIGSSSYQSDSVRIIAERYPGLKIIISHLGQPNPKAEETPCLWRLWEEQIDLGRLPNVWFDTASLPAYLAEEGYPFPSARRYFRWAVERIGPSKILWGTDVPGMLLHATYPQLLKLASIHTDFLSPYDRSLFLGGNAASIYGIGTGGGS